jgi:hypothetical protein
VDKHRGIADEVMWSQIESRLVLEASDWLTEASVPEGTGAWVKLQCSCGGGMKIRRWEGEKGLK